MTCEPGRATAAQTLRVGAPPNALAAILPEGAAHRLQRLMQAAEDARRLLPEFSERADASTARLEVESGLQLLTGHRSDGGFALDPESAPRVATLAALTSQAKRLGSPLGDAGGGISIGKAPLSIFEAWGP